MSAGCDCAICSRRRQTVQTLFSGRCGLGALCPSSPQKEHVQPGADTLPVLPLATLPVSFPVSTQHSGAAASVHGLAVDPLLRPLPRAHAWPS